MKRLPDTERLRELFTYEPDTGIVRWKIGSGGVKIGSIVGSVRKRYRRTQIQEEEFLLHRIIWKLHTGEDPYGMEIDHLDRDPLNNKWENLRLTDRSGNTLNRGIPKNNTIGYKGVSRSGKRYQSRLGYRGKRLCLGTYDTPEEASRVYEMKLMELENINRQE